MGVYGCAWVRWGAEVMGRHTNKASRHKNGCTGHDLGPMAGEISPNIMFCKNIQKKCTDDSGWVSMGLNGCGGMQGHGQEQKQGKERRNWMRGTCFATHVHSEKNEEVGRDGHGDQRRLFGGMGGKEEARGATWMFISK